MEEIEQFKEKKSKKIIENIFKIEDMNEYERKIFELLESKTHHVDELIYLTNLEPSIVSYTLIEMEMKEIIDKQPGNFYGLKHTHFS